MKDSDFIYKEKDRYRLGKKVSSISLAINSAMAVIKTAVGILFGSTAMIADGIHSASDMISTAAVMFSMAVSGKPADKNHPYGHEKAEPVAAKILALLLIVTGAGIIYSSVRTIRQADISSPGIMALYAALVSIFLKEWLYRITVRVGKKVNSTAMIADAWHHRSDAITSIAALAGITGARMGWPVLDPLAGIVVAGFIIKIGVDIYVKAAGELMDSAANPVQVQEIASFIREVPKVMSIYAMYTRNHGSRIYVDVEICVNKSIPVYEGHEIAHKVKENIINNMKSVKDVFVHVNPCIYTEEDGENCIQCRDTSKYGIE